MSARMSRLVVGPAIAGVMIATVACGELETGAPSGEPGTTQQSQELKHDLPIRRLTGWAALDHSERWPGPTTGHFIASGPYDDQPIPGWSGLLRNEDGTYLAMPDNGYGSKANSADYLLGFYTMTPTFKTKGDGTTTPGSVVNHSFVAFNDANALLANGAGVDLLITADFDSYRTGNGHGTNSGIAVDPSIREGRLLTGYDFDIESIARATDGSYWVGEEFGPYILHFDTNGTLIDEPVPHPFLKSPAHPSVLAFPGTHTLAASRGFESLAFDHAKRYLYALTEAAPVVDSLRAVPGDERVVQLFQFDPLSKQYTGVSYKYRKEGDATGNAIVIGDLTSVGPNKFVLIERDDFGLTAVVKRLYLVDLTVTDADGILKKRLLVDLLDIPDPRDIGGPLEGLAKKQFNFPFVSVECVLQLSPKVLAVAIDTNFPATGRDAAVPASTEIITLEFDKPVATFAPRP